MDTSDPVNDTPLRRSRGRPRKTADERDDGNRRQALLRAAAHLFRRKGFAATSTRDIAAAVGMRSGSPFYHFENKEALLAAVMAEGMQRALQHQRERMDAAVAAAPAALSARECLRVLVRGHFHNLLGPESDHIPVMLYEWRWLAPQQKQVVSELMAEYEAVWVPVLQALRREGALKGDTALARLLIFGALNWTAQWYDAEGSATLDDMTEAALQLFVKDVE